MNDLNFISTNSIVIPNISIGKKQVYDNKIFYPLYYKYDLNNKYQPFNFKTNRLFISNKFKKTNNKYVLELRQLNEFRDLIKKIESRITRLLKKRKNNKLKEKQFLSQIKNNDQLYLQIYVNSSKCIDIYQKTINNLNFILPTYGYFFLEFKNVWETKDKWGININIQGCMILPCQIFSESISTSKIKFIFKDESKLCKSLLKEEDDPKYQKYFKMKKMGIPIQAIKNKMLLDNLEPSIIDKHNTNSIAKLSINKNNKNSESNSMFLSSINSFNMKSLKARKINSETPITNNKYSNNNYPKISIDEIQTIINSLKKV